MNYRTSVLELGTKMCLWRSPCVGYDPYKTIIKASCSALSLASPNLNAREFKLDFNELKVGQKHFIVQIF